MKKGFVFTTELLAVCKNCSIVFKCFSSKAARCDICRKSLEFRTNMLDYKWRLRKLTAMARNRAKVKNLDFNIDEGYLISLWDSSFGNCAVSRRSFDLKPFGKKGQVNPNAPSVDRIVPELGYTKGNIRLVTYHVNVALSEFGLDELIKLAKDVAFR